MSQQQPARKTRRGLSCLPCRERKLRCSRHLPCHACIRFHRESECRKHPSPTIVGVNNMSEASGHHNNASLPSLSSSQGAAEKFRPAQALASLRPNPGTDPNANPQLARQLSSESRRTGESDLLDPALNLLSLSNNLINNDATAEHQHGRPLTTFSMDTIDSAPLSFIHELPPNPQAPERLSNTTPLLVSQSSSTGIEASLSAMDIDEQIYWRKYLTSVLPTQTQCDVLLSHFLDNLNWIHQVIHVPTFRKEYAKFWLQDVHEVDLSWLSLLFTIIAISSMRVPLEVCEFIGFQKNLMKKTSRLWYRASRQALHAAEFELKPCIAQLQTFVISQLYWLVTKQIEILNASLGHAVRAAQALGLDKQSYDTNLVERNIRHNLWWEICHADTFQSITLSRPPLIQSFLSEVPIPLNCNDIDMTKTSVNPQPLDVPTERSCNVLKAKLFKLFNKLWKDNGRHLTTYSYVAEIDAEIVKLIDEGSWFFKPDSIKLTADFPQNLKFIPWHQHIIHTCICMQRIRMYRPFLHPRVGKAWEISLAAADEVLSVFRRLRAEELQPSGPVSRRLQVQGFQLYSVGVHLAIFLLVEAPGLSPTTSTRLRNDIELIISDLNRITPLNGDLPDGLPVDIDGQKVLRRILDLYDERARNTFQSASATTTLVPSISTILGGESVARKYLEQSAIPYILNGEVMVPTARTNRRPQVAAATNENHLILPDVTPADGGLTESNWEVLEQPFDDNERIDSWDNWPALDYLEWEQWEPLLFGAYDTGDILH